MGASIRRAYIIILTTVAIAGVAFATVYVSIFNSSFQNIDIELYFNEYDAYDCVEDQLDIGYRIPGTAARSNCSDYFVSQFKEINPDYSYELHNFTVHSTDCQNLLFKLNEDNPTIVILASHYDSRAKATKESGKENQPVPGANDGASSSAVLVEIAAAMEERKNELDCQIWFLFFDAEDQGNDGEGYGIQDWDFCEGSQEFVNDLDKFYHSSQESIDCMVLLDLVGGPNLQFIRELWSTQSLLDELFETGRQLGYTYPFPLYPISQQITDDHKAFVDAGIPAVDLIIKFWDNSDWPYHHKTGDDISKITRESLEITGKTVEQFIYNNYYSGEESEKEGSHTWDDPSALQYQILVFSIIIVGITVGTFGSFYFIHRKTIRKAEEDRKNELKTENQKVGEEPSKNQSN